MRHFVAYHNAEKMGREYTPMGEFSFFSRKAPKYLEQTVDGLVWAINGSRSKSRATVYTLCAIYSPDQVVDTDDAEFDYIVAGSVGHDFAHPIPLNNLAWFPGFLRSQSNFSLGINEIKDALFVKALTALAKDADLPDLMDSRAYSWPFDLDSRYVEGIEGTENYVLHLRRERNAEIVEAKKRQVLAQSGRLACEVCDFDFAERYGKLGEGYCEVHHKIPLASLKGHRTTRLADLAVVCSNCHRVLHKTSPMPSISVLSAHIKRRKA